MPPTNQGVRSSNLFGRAIFKGFQRWKPFHFARLFAWLFQRYLAQSSKVDCLHSFRERASPCLMLSSSRFGYSGMLLGYISSQSPICRHFRPGCGQGIAEGIGRLAYCLKVRYRLAFTLKLTQLFLIALIKRRAVVYPSRQKHRTMRTNNKYTFVRGVANGSCKRSGT